MPTPPGFSNCSYEFTQSGLTRPAYITFGVDSTDTDPSMIATQLYAAWSSAGSMKSIMDSSATLTGIRVSAGTDGAADLVYLLRTSDPGGGSVSQALPPNCAVLVHKTSARGGRRGRGRIYLPWVANESVVDEAGILAPANVTTLQTAMTAWKVALATSGNPMVLLHDPGKTSIPAPDPVTSLLVDRLIATQRRRLGR